MYQKFVGKFNAISFNIILGLTTLLPFFVLPLHISALGAVKGVLLYIGVFLAFSLWLVAQFINGAIQFPKHKVLLVLTLLVLSSLVSAIVSINTKVSLWGRGFAFDSFATILVIFLFTALVSIFASEQKRLVKLFLGAFSGSVATILLQVLLYVTQKTSFVSTHFSHVATSGSLVGSWIDFGYFVTFTLILSILMHEVLIPKGFFKFLSLCATILSLIVLIFLNFKAAWVITLVSALLIFVYKFSVERSMATKKIREGVGEESQKFPLMSFSILLIGLFFFLSAGSIGTALSRYAGITFTDFRPSFSTTTHIMRATLLKDPLFGSGAGRFGDMWNLYRPKEINNTIFWNTPFESGFNLMETLATTQGALVAVSFVVLFILVLATGFKLFSYSFPDTFSRFIAVTSFIMFIAFVGLFMLASPGLILVIYGFLYMGLLLGVSVLVGRTKVTSLQFLKDPRMSFFAILFMVILTLLGFTATYASGSRFAGIIYFNRALKASTFERATNSIDRAISLSPNDIFFRTRTALFVNQFNQNVQESGSDQTVLQQYFTQAEQSAAAAVAWDRNNAANWLVLSQVYQLLAGSSEDAYNNAIEAVNQSQKLNPNSPVIILTKAQLAALKQKSQEAFEYANQSIDLKSDYQDAYVFKAGLKRSLGDTSGALEELNKYATISPYNPDAYILLGSYYIGQNDYQSAVVAYSRAFDLNPTNPNVHLQYISALYKAGNKTKAIEELKSFKEKYPQVEGIDEEIKRLQNATL